MKVKDEGRRGRLGPGLSPGEKFRSLWLGDLEAAVRVLGLGGRRTMVLEGPNHRFPYSRHSCPTDSVVGTKTCGKYSRGLPNCLKVKMGISLLTPATSLESSRVARRIPLNRNTHTHTHHPALAKDTTCAYTPTACSALLAVIMRVLCITHNAVLKSS